MRQIFSHRSNRDGSYDSICTVCLVAIATASAESGLARHERNHACDPIRLYQLSEYPRLPGLANSVLSAKQ